MSSNNCPEGGKEISNQEKNCPNCGNNNEQQKGTGALVIANIISILFLCINMIIPFILLIIRFFSLNKSVVDIGGLLDGLIHLMDVNTVLLTVMSMFFIFFLVKRRTKFSSACGIIFSILILIGFINQITLSIILYPLGGKKGIVKTHFVSIIHYSILLAVILLILLLHVKKKTNGMILSIIWVVSYLIISAICATISFVSCMITYSPSIFIDMFLSQFSTLRFIIFDNPFIYSALFINPLTAFMNIVLLITNIPLIVANKKLDKK